MSMVGCSASMSLGRGQSGPNILTQSADLSNSESQVVIPAGERRKLLTSAFDDRFRSRGTSRAIGPRSGRRGSGDLRFWVSIASLKHPHSLLFVRYPDGQGQSLAFAALDRHLPAMFPDNPADDQQAKARTRLFGGKIGFEHATEVFGRDSAAGVGETDDHVIVIHIGAGAKTARALHRFQPVLVH